MHVCGYEFHVCASVHSVYTMKVRGIIRNDYLSNTCALSEHAEMQSRKPKSNQNWENVDPLLNGSG